MAPFAPRKPKIFPFVMEKEIPFTATAVPFWVTYCYFRFLSPKGTRSSSVPSTFIYPIRVSLKPEGTIYPLGYCVRGNFIFLQLFFVFPVPLSCLTVQEAGLFSLSYIPRIGIQHSSISPSQSSSVPLLHVPEIVRGPDVSQS